MRICGMPTKSQENPAGHLGYRAEHNRRGPYPRQADSLLGKGIIQIITPIPVILSHRKR